MEKKYDMRVELIEEIINSQKNIEKLQESIDESTTANEAELINSIINAEKEKLAYLEEQKKSVCNELSAKKEQYEEKCDKVYEDISQIMDEKKYFENLISIGENTGLSEKDNEGRYKDAIQENRVKKINELDQNLMILQAKLEKNIRYIHEIDKTLMLLGFENNISKQNEDNNISKQEEKETTVENEEKNIVDEGNKILEDLPKDYANTHKNVQTKFDKDIEIKVDNEKETEGSDDKEQENIKNNEKEFNESLNNDKKPNIKEEADKIIKDISMDYANTNITPDLSYDRTRKVKIEKEDNKEKNIFKRIYRKITSFKLVKNITRFFGTIKNKTKLLTAGKENAEKDISNIEVENKEDKKVTKQKLNVQKVTVENVIERMEKAVAEKCGKNEIKKEEDERVR